MLSDNTDVNRRRIESFVRQAAAALAPELQGRFKSRQVENALEEVLYRLYNEDWASSPGMTLALNTGSIMEPIPMIMKNYVRLSVEYQMNPPLDDLGLTFDTETLVELADEALDIVIKSPGDLYEFLTWFMESPVSTLVRRKRTPRFRGYYFDSDAVEQLQVPSEFPDSTRNYIENIENAFMTNVVIPNLHLDELQVPFREKCISVVKALSEWVWRTVVESEEGKNALHIACPSVSAALHSLYISALGAAMTEAVGRRNEFRSNSPTMGLAMLQVTSVQQAVLLGIRVSADDIMEVPGEPITTEGVKYLVLLDKELPLKDQRIPIRTGLNTSQNISDTMLRLFRESLWAGCINAAKTADDENGPKPGDDPAVDLFRDIVKKTTRANRQQEMIAAADGLIRDGVIEPYSDLRLAGEEYSGTIGLSLVKLCDHVWETATGRNSLGQAELDADEGKSLAQLKAEREHDLDDDFPIPPGLEMLGGYEDRVKITREELGPAYTKPTNVSQIVAFGVGEIAGSQTDKDGALLDYPFRVEDGGLVYRDAPSWKTLQQQLNKKKESS